jgi:hypothetical protein
MVEDTAMLHKCERIYLYRYTVMYNAQPEYGSNRPIKLNNPFRISLHRLLNTMTAMMHINECFLS